MGRKSSDYYKILGVSKNASVSEIKKAYRKLIKIYHPDIYGNGKSDFVRLLNEAYKILSNPETRKIYDEKNHSFWDSVVEVVRKVYSIGANAVDYNKFSFAGKFVKSVFSRIKLLFRDLNSSHKNNTLSINEIIFRIKYSSNPFVRANALKMLASKRKKRFVYIFVDMLSDPSVEVRKVAVEIIGDMKVKTAVGKLIEMFHRENSSSMKRLIFKNIMKIGSAESERFLNDEIIANYPSYKNFLIKFFYTIGLDSSVIVDFENREEVKNLIVRTFADAERIGAV